MISPEWTDVTYQHGWVVYDPAPPPDSWGPVQFMKDALGFVHLRGLTRAGTLDAIFTLPVGCRPGRDYLFPVMTDTALGRVDVYPNGNVTQLSGSNGWVSLNGISFLAEA